MIMYKYSLINNKIGLVKIGLVRDLDKDIPFDKVTVKLLKSLDYGRDIQLNDKFTISKHSEEDMFDIHHTETGEDLYSVSWDWDTDEDNSIEFEQVYHDKATYGRYNDMISCIGYRGEE